MGCIPNVRIVCTPFRTAPPNLIVHGSVDPTHFNYILAPRHRLLADSSCLRVLCLRLLCLYLLCLRRHLFVVDLQVPVVLLPRCLGHLFLHCVVEVL